MASKKSDRIDRLLYVLEHANSWVSAAMLAKMLDTSERTIRNYVAEINRQDAQRIESSNDGYRLASDRAHASEGRGRQDAEQSGAVRRNYALSRLVNAREGVSVFDLAEELHISESTLSSGVLPGVRKLVGQFGLAIDTHSFTMRLIGNEQDKRRLLGFLATHDAGGYFSSAETLEELFPDFDVHEIASSLVEICQRSDLLINDFALNNLLMHVLVIVIRLQSDHRLAERDDLIDVDRMLEEFSQRNEIIRCADRFARYVEERFGCKIPETDYRQIVLLIALSVERYDYGDLSLESLARLIDQEFLDLVKQIADETAARYGIPAFDEALLLQLTLHMYNAYQRAAYHVSYPNPLAAQIKRDYAPVYDMAVHFAHRFSRALGCEMDENEIAFIAFHIGAYLERCSETSNVATCVIVVGQYHDFANQLVADIKRVLDGDATVVGIMNEREYLDRRPECDLVIAMHDVVPASGERVCVGPILTKRGERAIRERLDAVIDRKQTSHARQFLRGMLAPELFLRNLRLEGGRDAYIDYLGGLAMQLGYTDAEFVQDVHLRENASSTAFVDELALPHSLGVYARRSFIAVLHNDAPLDWGGRDVHFVMMIGIAKEDMTYFRDAFDLIVEFFSSVDKTVALMRTDSFEEFVEVFAGEAE